MSDLLPALEPQLVLHEGLRLRIYKDTEGYDTLGVGYNVSARGIEDFERVIGRKIIVRPGVDLITRQEALTVLRADLLRVIDAVRVHFPYYTQLDLVRQCVVVDMAFNMGFRALGFKQCIDAIQRRDWSRAARELYNSKWSRQVGDGPGGKRDRCDRLAGMLLTGNAPTDVPTLAA